MTQPNQNLVGVLKENPTTPKYQSINPVDQPNFSGESTHLSWSSQELKDKGSITIKSKTFSLIKPDTFIHLGFGMGWLEEQPDGTPFKNIDVDTALGVKKFTYEDLVGKERRHVYTHNGVKCLRSIHNSGGASAVPAGAGFINFDTGSDIPAGQHTIMYGETLLNRKSEDVGKIFQFKQDRIAQFPDLNGDGNSTYVKQDPGSPDGAINCSEGNTARAYYFGLNAPLVDNALTDFYWAWKINTPDVHDGNIYTLCTKKGKTVRSWPVHSGTPPHATCVVKSNILDRPRWLKRQDYMGNNTYGATDVEALVFNLFWQRGGHMFVLGDKALPELCSRLIPLIPTSFNDDGSWTLNLWKENIENYSDCTVYVLDSGLNVVAGVPLK